MQSSFRIDVSADREISIVALSGRLDVISSPLLEQKLQELVSGGCRRLIVDFGGLDLIVSAGLRVFLAFAKNCKKTGGRMALCGMKPVVGQVFELAGFTQIFATFAAREEAVQSLRIPLA